MVYLSKEKIKELEAEYKTLKESLLIENEEQTIRGGLLDSFEQAAAFSISKEAKEKRVNELNEIISKHTNLPEYTEGDEIVIGKVFDLKIDNVVKRFQLVDPFEADSTKGLISVESPLGKAVYKKRCKYKFAFNGKKIIILQIL